MAAIIHALRKATENSVDVETLKVVAIFCGVGLAISLIVASYGVSKAGRLGLGPLMGKRYNGACSI